MVGGQASFWDPLQPALADGAWHVLRVTVSEHWVTLEADGTTCHRVTRRGFKANPLAGVAGIGAVVWGGRIEVEGPRMAALR